ncbi:MAG: excisionase family DNA-binding protein [Ignavibacteriales bacterium]|nr:excisionase family DNA-binding protein [Ignavibacteriales bacterium]
MENITNEKQLLAVSRAAKVLHLGKDTMYKLIEEGKIGYIAIGKRKKIPTSELDGFKERNLTFEKLSPHLQISLQER